MAVFDLTASPYSAVGDGQTDNTGAITAWLADLAATGGIGIAPAGNYLYYGPSGTNGVMPGSGCVIMGAGQYQGPGSELIIVGISASSTPQITTNSPHGLRSTDQYVFIRNSTPNIDGQRQIDTIIDAYNFTITGPTTSTSGTAGYFFVPNYNATQVTGAVLTSAMTASQTNLPVTSTGGLVAGQTIVVEGECMYVHSVDSGTSATVVRGVNNTSVSGGPGAAHASGAQAYSYSGTRFLWKWHNITPDLGSQASCAWFLNGVSGVTLRDFTISSYGRSGTRAQTITDGVVTAGDQTGWALLCLNNCTNCLIDNVETATSGNLGMINQGTGGSGNVFRNTRCHDTIKDGLALAWDGPQYTTAFSPECFDNGDDAISVNALYLESDPSQPNPPRFVQIFGPRVHDGKIDSPTSATPAWAGNGIAIIAQHVSVHGGFVRTVCSNGVIVYDFWSTGGTAHNGINVTAHHLDFIGLDVSGTGRNLNLGTQGHGANVFGAREVRFDGCRFSDIMQHGARFYRWGKNIWFINNRLGSAGLGLSTRDGIGVLNESSSSGSGSTTAGAWDGITIIADTSNSDTGRLATFYGAFNEIDATNSSSGATPPQLATTTSSNPQLGFDYFYIEGNEFTACDHAAISIYGVPSGVMGVPVRFCNVVQVYRNRTANNNLGGYSGTSGPCYFLGEVYCQCTDNFDHDRNMFGIPANRPSGWSNVVVMAGTTVSPPSTSSTTSNVSVYGGATV